MPVLIIVGAVTAVYGGIGLVMRAKFFPRAPVQDALLWPIALGMGRK